MSYHPQQQQQPGQQGQAYPPQYAPAGPYAQHYPPQYAGQQCAGQQPGQPYGQPYAQAPYGQPYSPPPPVQGQNFTNPSYASPQPTQYGEYGNNAPIDPSHVRYVPSEDYNESHAYPPMQHQQLQRDPEVNQPLNDVGLSDPIHAEGQTGEKLSYPSGASWRDKGFFIAFLVHLAVLIILAFVFGPKLTRDINASSPTGTSTTGEQDDTSPNVFIALLIVSAVIGAVFSILWLSVMKRYSGQIIHISLMAVIGLAIVGAIVALGNSQVAMGVLFILMAGLMTLYYYFVRARIPFATAILRSSVHALQTHSGPFYLVYGLTLVQIAFLALWSFTFVAVYHAATKLETTQNPNGTYSQQRVSNNGGLGFLQFFLVMSMYWTLQTIKYIGHTTTAGTVASWWLMPQVTSPTKASFVRASTTSIGSICFAALLVAIIETVRALLQQARNNARSCATELADCLLQSMDRALRWFNAYALCLVAIYGTPFLESAKRTGQLFQGQLFTALINDDLSGLVLFCGSFLAGTIAAIVGALWAHGKHENGAVVMAILAFLVGFLVATLAMSVVKSAVSTTFVCWAMDPSALSHNRPAEFSAIVNAGRNKYQGIEQYAGGAEGAQQPQQQI